MDRRQRHEALRRRAFGVGIAVSLALHAAALAFIQFRVDAPRGASDEPVRLLPRVAEPQPPPEPERRPARLIRIRPTQPQLAAGEPAPARAAAGITTVPEPSPQLAGAAPPAAAALRLPVPAVLMLEIPGQGAAPRVDGVVERDPLGVPLYEPGTVGRVKRGWLTAAGLNPRGAAVAIWVVGCPAPRTIVSSDPRPTFRGRPCH